MSEWRRPVLCRLCQCPVGGVGVPVSRLDKAKFSCWWLEVLRTDWDDEKPGDNFICQFCLWDAKFYGKEDSGDCDWWTGHTHDELFYRHYYQEENIQPCSVMLRPLSTQLPDQVTEADEQNAKRKSKKGILTQCIYCGETFKSRNAAFQHTNEVHEEYKDISCSYCMLHFATFKERREHFKTHRKLSKCHFCFGTHVPGAMKHHVTDCHADRLECCKKRFENIVQLVNHMCSNSIQMTNKRVCIYCKTNVRRHFHKHVQKHHGSVAIRCHYFACHKYFHSHEDKQKHVAERHESKPNLFECIYCKCKVVRNFVPKHMLKYHKSVSVRCDFNGCISYFHTEAEKLQHRVQVHFATKAAPKVTCIYCGHIVNFESDLYLHVKNYHNDIEVFRCKIIGCSEYFLTDSDLQSHFLVEHAAREAKRKWQCGQCSYRAFENKHLEKHIELKHGTENLKCPRCSKICKSQYSLQTHVNKAHRRETFCEHCKSIIKCSKHTHLRVRPCRYCQRVMHCMSLKKSHVELCRLQQRDPGK